MPEEKAEKDTFYYSNAAYLHYIRRRHTCSFVIISNSIYRGYIR